MTLNTGIISERLTISTCSAIVVNRSTFNRITIIKRISPCSIWTGAHSNVTPRCTHCSRAAFFTGAWILTSEIDASFIIRALAICKTFSSLTACQCISDVTGGAGADRSLLSGIVVARSANRVHAAWIRFA